MFIRKDNKSRVIKPFYDICGKEYPFGEVGEDGVYKIVYDDVMDGEYGGYKVEPIYGVRVYLHITMTIWRPFGSMRITEMPRSR